MSSDLHPAARAFATLLDKRTAWDEHIAESIAELFKTYSDHKKADLYAMVVERVRANMSYGEMLETVNQCLRDNDG